MRSAIVFGATGQLGGAVAEQLLAQGWRVSAVTREGRAPPAATQAIDGTGKTRRQVLDDHDHPVDAVFDPTTYTEADAHDLIAARGRFASLVVLSSSSVYADPDGRSLDEAGETGFPRFDGPIAETTATVAPSALTYSTRKVAMERAVLSSSLDATVLRPCAIYGIRATHPREWWFIKRALDGRPSIPVAFNADSVFHTSSARGIASLAALCMAQPDSRVLNVADTTAPTVRQIAQAIHDATGLALGLAPFEGAPVGSSHVGSTPWSAERPFVLDTARARALGWVGDDYRDQVVEVCRWVLDVARAGDWRTQFTRYARYGYDPFDYAAEDAFLKASPA